MKLSKLIEAVEKTTGKKIILESEETIKNPDTGRMIKVSSALSYPKDSKVYKLAIGTQNKTVDKPIIKSKELNDAEKFMKDESFIFISNDRYPAIPKVLANLLPKDVADKLEDRVQNERGRKYNSLQNIIKKEFKKVGLNLEIGEGDDDAMEFSLEE